MEDSRQDLQELIALRSNLETALKNGDKEEIKRVYDKFRKLYEKITGKKFEDGVDPEKLAQIEAVVSGTVKPAKNADDIESVIEF